MVDISIVFMGFINQQTSLGGHHLVQPINTLGNMTNGQQEPIEHRGTYLFFYGRKITPKKKNREDPNNSYGQTYGTFTYPLVI